MVRLLVKPQTVELEAILRKEGFESIRKLFVAPRLPDEDQKLHDRLYIQSRPQRASLMVNPLCLKSQCLDVSDMCSLSLAFIEGLRRNFATCGKLSLILINVEPRIDTRVPLQGSSPARSGEILWFWRAPERILVSDLPFPDYKHRITLRAI
jgi:hypothetical protein